jgi:anti-sigma factor RsiW
MGDLSCQRFVDLVGDYLEGLLAPEERKAMTAHRLECRECSELLGDYERIPGLVRRATHATVPAGAQARLWRLLAQALGRRR